ncbi:MAG: AAA family ATPase [Phycisphaeraceae bacterium]
MRSIAIINQKGGCGKTTVSINLAATLAARGRRTLLVDMDPQGHCALGLAVPDSRIERSMADLLRAGLDGSVALADLTWQIARHLDLAPANISLAGVEQALATAPDKDRRLTQVLATVQDDYDYCIIDCPPSIGLLTFNALRAARDVLIPVETGYFAMQGSIRQEQTIEMLARRAAHHVRFKVLPTMYDVRTKLAREILSELKRHFGDKLLPVVINFNAKLKEAASFGQPITEYDAASRGMQDFERLAAWLEANPPAPVPGMETAASSATAAPLSRAAELVERARLLAARSAAVTGKLQTDRDVQTANALREPAPEAEAVDQSLQDKLARLYGVRQTAQGLLFVQPGQLGERLAVAGDFNQWQPRPMQRHEQLGVWQACLDVQPGRYRYRLLVDGEWTHDTYNTAVEPDGDGQLNNIVEVGPAAGA